jgi:siroheme synthase (precorrin-2 oxidase/ferrochelatase)
MMKRPGLGVSLLLAGQQVVVVGDDALAGERVARLDDAGALVTHVAAAAYEASLCAGARVVFAMVDDEPLAARITADARAAGALAYAHDRPALSDFAMPALARRGAVSLAVTTDGVAPALARRLRQELQRLLDDAGFALDGLVAALEAERRALPPGEARRAALQRSAERLSLRGRIDIDIDIDSTRADSNE